VNALIIDDNREMRRKITTDLQQLPFFERITEAADGMEGIKQLSDAPPDLILCDIEMPHMDGLRFLQIVRSKPETMHVPVLFLTGKSNRDMKLKGLTEGAHDFIQIPYDPQELFARAKLHAAYKRKQDMLLKQNAELEQLTNKDCLTGAFNRRYLYHILNTEVSRTARTHGVMSVLMLDIDHFKQINDSCGHQTGDLVLKQLTTKAVDCLRSYDFFFRYGGEEFVVVLPNTGKREAYKTAQRLCYEMRTMRFARADIDLKVTVSIGVAEYLGGASDSAEELLSRADQALYEAKSNGRNQVSCYCDA